MSEHLPNLKTLAEACVSVGEYLPGEAWTEDRSYSPAEVAWLEFAAQATPTAVLALIAENAALRKELNRLREDRDSLLEAGGHILDRPRLLGLPDLSGAAMSRFIAVVHGWHVESKGFDVHELKARNSQTADDEACLLDARRDAAFDRTAYVVVEVDDREHLPRRLTWRERLTGRIEQPLPPTTQARQHAPDVPKYITCEQTKW